MDNSFEALLMGASAILFVIALSIGVFTYSRIMETTDNMLSTSEKNDRKAEYFSPTESYERSVSGAEVLMTIYDMYYGDDIKYKTIKIPGATISVVLDEKGNLVGTPSPNDFNTAINSVSLSSKYKMFHNIENPKIVEFKYDN